MPARSVSKGDHSNISRRVLAARTDGRLPSGETVDCRLEIHVQDLVDRGLPLRHGSTVGGGILQPLAMPSVGQFGTGLSELARELFRQAVRNGDHGSSF